MKLAGMVAWGAAALAAAFLAWPNPTQGQEGARGATAALVTANGQFAGDILKGIHEDGKNTFYSPLSVSMILQLTAEGAAGETRAEMLKTLHTEGLDSKVANRELLKALASRGDVTLRLANGVFVIQPDVQLKPEFERIARSDFNAVARRVEADPQQVINGWVSEKTEGMIPQLIDQVPGDAVAYLINAIYFKGDWTATFDKDRTRESDFTRADDSKVKVQMMSQRGQFLRGDAPGARVLRLTYGKEGDTAMWLALPAEGESVDALARAFNHEKLAQWRKAATQGEAVVEIPRFQMRYKRELGQDLRRLGMRKAFSGAEADFSEFASWRGGNLFISRVLHEAVIIVNEEGTEAAAATAVDMRRTSAPRQPFVFRADRPFLFAITDEPTGAILFAGVMHDPS
jgi:serine protease inhibitor